MRKIIFSIVGILIVTSAAFAAKDENAVVALGKEEPQGGTLNYNIKGEPTTLNPVTQTDLYSRWVLGYVTDYLMARNDDTFKYEPVLAEKLDISKDGLTFTFTIRKGVKWHDGQPLTPEDVKFSFEVIRDPTYNAAEKWPYYDNIEKIELVGDDQVRIKMKEKYFKNQETLCETYIIPKHIYGDAKEGVKKNKTIIASGPYKMTEYDQGKKIVVEKVPNWWGDSLPQFKGRFNFQKVVFRFIADATPAIEALKKGELDTDDLTAESYVKRAVGPEWGTKVDKVEAKNKSAKSYGFIGWNLKHPQFVDRDVRVALAMLMNRKLMNEKFRFNKAVLASGPFYFAGPSADPSVKPFEYDPKKAVELLKKAGWADTDKDGVLDKVIDGKKVDFKFSLMYGNKDTEKYWTLYKEDMKKVGIEMELKLVEWNAMTKAIDDRNYDSFAMAWGGVFEEDPKQIWHSSSDVKGGSNFVGYHNADVDDAIMKARVEMDDKKRSALMQKVFRLIANDAPYAFMFNERYDWYAVSKKTGRVKDSFTYDVGRDYWFQTKSAQ